MPVKPHPPMKLPPTMFPETLARAHADATTIDDCVLPPVMATAEKIAVTAVRPMLTVMSDLCRSVPWALDSAISLTSNNPTNR